LNFLESRGRKKLLKVTSKTPLYEIIEAVRDQYHVNVDYGLAREIRDSFSRGSAFEAGGLLVVPREKPYITWKVNPERATVCVGEQVFSIAEWNAQQPPVKLRRRPRWYVAIYDLRYRYEDEDIEPTMAGPYGTLRDATDTAKRLEKEDGMGAEVLVYTEAKRLGLIEDD
jgi:hypothetical protein